MWVIGERNYAHSWLGDLISKQKADIREQFVVVLIKRTCELNFKRKCAHQRKLTVDADF